MRWVGWGVVLGHRKGSRCGRGSENISLTTDRETNRAHSSSQLVKLILYLLFDLLGLLPTEAVQSPSLALRVLALSVPVWRRVGRECCGLGTWSPSAAPFD